MKKRHDSTISDTIPEILEESKDDISSKPGSEDNAENLIYTSNGGTGDIVKS